MLEDLAFHGAGGDASKELPAGFPKSFIQKPIIFTISEHLPSELLSTHETAAATASRAYEKVIVTQMSLSKNLAAEELKKLCDSHSASFSDELPSFFTDNVLASDRTRHTSGRMQQPGGRPRVAQPGGDCPAAPVYGGRWPWVSSSRLDGGASTAFNEHGCHSSARTRKITPRYRRVPVYILHS
jgi:hypothetical protein